MYDATQLVPERNFSEAEKKTYARAIQYFRSEAKRFFKFRDLKTYHKFMEKVVALQDFLAKWVQMDCCYLEDMESKCLHHCETKTCFLHMGE